MLSISQGGDDEAETRARTNRSKEFYDDHKRTADKERCCRTLSGFITDGYSLGAGREATCHQARRGKRPLQAGRCGSLLGRLPTMSIETFIEQFTASGGSAFTDHMTRWDLAIKAIEAMGDSTK